MLLLKNNWSLTGELTGSSTTTGSGVKFTTAWYDEKIASPQVTVTPAWTTFRPLTLGPNMRYRVDEVIHINAWVRPTQDSNRSIGWAKNAVFQMKEEITRIIQAANTLGIKDLNFVFIRDWRRFEDTSVRPVVFRNQVEVAPLYFKP